MQPTDVLNLLLLLLVIAGHLLLVRELTARLYRLAMPWALWLGVFGLLLASCVALPWLLVRHVGLHGPRVLRGGQWTAAPPAWQAYAATCLLGLAASALARLLARKDPALLAERGETIDVAARLDCPPAGAGVRAWLARLPGNELFRVEVAERELAIPRLPAVLDGLSILHLTDLHFNGTPGRAFFEQAIDLALPLRPDLVALTGDILDRHARSDWLATTLGRLEAPLGCYFVLGNHDALDDPERIRAAMRELGWIDVGSRAVRKEARGQAIVIAGNERPWIGRLPETPDDGPDAFRLLLSHTPEQFGWARSRGFDLVLAGHLHGGQIDLPLFGPISGGRYHAGVFSAGPTVMHVSRGLGVMFPVRLNCPAEMTKLILRGGPAPRSGGAAGLSQVNEWERGKSG